MNKQLKKDIERVFELKEELVEIIGRHINSKKELFELSDEDFEETVKSKIVIGSIALATLTLMGLKKKERNKAIDKRNEELAKEMLANE